jgi:F420-dependent methylenetetrahydromethanopterin dehydrogenase
MEIDRDHVIQLLREKGKDERVQHAIDRLPQKVDHEKHAQELEKLGIDPGELLAKAGHGLLG